MLKMLLAELKICLVSCLKNFKIEKIGKLGILEMKPMS